MTNIAFLGSEPVRSLEQAAQVLVPRKANQELIGIEAEAYLVKDQTAVPVETKAFEEILFAYQKLTGFTEFIREGNILTGLAGGTGLHEGATITVEPGFQPEYAGSPKKNLHEIAETLDQHLLALSQAAHGYGHTLVMTGLHPLVSGVELPLIGKERYRFMNEQALRLSGDDGLTAMRGTTGVQYNFDTSAKSWAQQYRTAFALQPFANALSGNSPYKNAEPTGDASHRSVLWFKSWGGDWAKDVAETVFFR